MTKSSETIAERIRDLRKSKGLTQSELAEKLNLTDKAVSKWESGEGEPNIGALADLAVVLDTTTDYLLTGKKPVEKTVVISKKEQAAKEDIIELASYFYGDFFKSSEDEPSLFEYTKKYSSKKILTHYAKTYAYKNQLYGNKDFVATLIDLNLREALISIGVYGRNPFLRLDNHREQQMNDIIGHTVFHELFNHPGIEDETKDLFFDSKVQGYAFNDTPGISSYETPLEYAFVEKNEKAIDYLIHFFHDLNDAFWERFQEKPPKSGDKSYFDQIQHQHKRYGLMAAMVLSPEQIQELITDGFYKEAISEDAYNKELGAPTVDPSKVKFAQMKLDGVKDEYALKLQTIIRDGLMDLTDLLATKDFAFIERALKEQPILYEEICYQYAKKGDYRSLYHFYVDYHIQTDAVLSGEKEKILSQICSLHNHYYLSSPFDGHYSFPDVEKRNEAFLRSNLSALEEENLSLEKNHSLS
jgi:transcriptional regulator with XRE-family HTH domain